MDVRPIGYTGAALQAAIDRLRRAGGGVLRCESGAVYTCDAPIRCDDLVQVTIAGARSLWLFPGPLETCVTARSAIQLAIRDVRLRATHPAFAGHLLSTGWSPAQRDTSHLTVACCEFVSDGPARAALRLDRGIFVVVDQCQFQGANWGILGLDGSYSNVVTIRGCAFYSLRHAAIMNAGEAWTIDGNGFEPLVSGAACAYTQDIATTAAKSLVMRGNWCGDITTPGGCWVAVRASGLVLEGNYFGSPGGPGDPCLRLFACQGVSVTGNHNQTSNTFLEFRPEAGHSRNVTLTSNDLGIGAVTNQAYCLGLRLINNFGQADVP
jgi:hypothetical protein